MKKNVIKVGEISYKDDILTIEEKQLSLIMNKTERNLEMTPRQRDIEARCLKVAKMRINKRIE